MKNFSVIIDKTTRIFKINLLLVAFCSSCIFAQDITDFYSWLGSNGKDWTDKDNWGSMFGADLENFPNDDNAELYISGMDALIPSNTSIKVKKIADATMSGESTINLQINSGSSLTVNTEVDYPNGNIIVSGDGDFIVRGDFVCKDFIYNGSGNFVFGGTVTITGDIKIGGNKLDLGQIYLTVAPLGGTAVYIKLDSGSMKALAAASSSFIDKFVSNLFSITENSSASSAVSVAGTSIVRSEGQVSWVKLSLSGLGGGGITIDDLQKYYVSASKDGVNTVSHPLSDYAVGAVNVLWAYDNRYNATDYKHAVGDSLAIRNWDADQGANGSLLFGQDFTLSAQIASTYGAKLYLSKENLRSSLTDGIWTKLNGSGGGTTISGKGQNPEIFNISTSSQSGWQAGGQISFTFAITDISGTEIEVGATTGTSGNQQKHKLYAARLRIPGDINTLDLWSFRVRDFAAAMRGGVTIRNNVINAGTGERVTLEVDTPENGRLNVILMTLSGNVISYLERGNVGAGKRTYHWDGRNNAGNLVARGIYFIRITGCGIDETRKVMVVK